MRPLLRPGTHVLSRADGQLQVGLDPRGALVLPDVPDVRSALAGLDGSGGSADHAPTRDEGTLGLLDAQGLLLDERSLLPHLGADAVGPARHATAALARRAGDRSPQALAARRSSRVAVVGFGHPSADRLRTTLGDLLTGSGLRIAGSGHGSRPPTVGVLVGVGEPDRELLDVWTRAGTPYALVRLTEGQARLGPFVVPGTTACLRCVDAHHTDADPAWPLLVRQYAAASSRDRPDGAPEPVDPALATLAVAWAARDLVTYVDGGRPSTWSSTLTLDPVLAGLETHAWHRHPECACSWS